MWKNIGSNWTLNVVQILVFMVLTPFTVNTLGKGPFGVWEAIQAAGGPLQLLILGVPMATVRAISAHLAKDDPESASRAIGTSLSLTLLMGVATLVLAGLVFAGFDAGMLRSADWALSPQQLTDARLAFWIFVGSLAAGFSLRLPYAVFDAQHDFVVRNLVMGGGMLLRLGLTVGLLLWHSTLTSLAVVHALVTLAEFAVARGLSRRRHQGMHFRPGRLERRAVVDLLSFSVFALLLNMGAMLAFRIDALVVGAALDNDHVTIYGLGNKIFDPLINLLLAIGMVVMPMATTLSTRGRTDELRDVLLKWSKVAFALVWMLGAYLAVLAPEFLEWWLRDEYHPESGRVQQVLMASFFLFLPVRGVALPILMGIGRPRKPAFGLLGMGIANLLLSLALVRSYGVIGVALGTAIPNVVFALWFVSAACREVGVGAGRYLSYAVLRPLLGLLPGLALLLGLKLGPGVHGFLPLFGTGLAFVALYGVSQVLFVWRGDPYLDPMAKLRTRLGRG